jgi:hypothetical protein
MMKVEIELYIDEHDESVVMEKVSSITKQAKELGFKIDELEFKSSKNEKEEEKKKTGSDKIYKSH